MATAQGGDSFTANLNKVYGIYTGGFIAFIILMAILGALGVPNVIIGYLFVAFTILIYAAIGIMSRTMQVGEYYVAGRRVPAIYNGMATGADWMSGASFVGMAGTLYLLGYNGLAFVLGWTGGYVLVAILVAPFLRKFGAYTVPDFLSARYGGNLARFAGIVVLFSCSFTYVVAQIFATGIIASRFLGLDFTFAVYVGLAGILVCSMLGGMRAVTWTQVAQYIVLIIAYLIPAIWMSTVMTGVPIPQIMQGQALQNIVALEQAQGIAVSHITPFVSGGYDALNYFLLILCLMVGTASLPHILMRYFTTPSVREARSSVAWSLLFIFILYFTAPAYAAFAKWTMLELVQSGLTPENIAEKAGWMMSWAQADGALVRICGAAAVSVEAIAAACSAQGVEQIAFSNIALNADMIVLATPEMAGMPYVISGMVAAGGLAAALSTADGLLLAIAILVGVGYTLIRPQLTPPSGAATPAAAAGGALEAGDDGAGNDGAGDDGTANDGATSGDGTIAGEAAPGTAGSGPAVASVGQPASARAGNTGAGAATTVSSAQSRASQELERRIGNAQQLVLRGQLDAAGEAIRELRASSPSPAGDEWERLQTQHRRATELVGTLREQSRNGQCSQAESTLQQLSREISAHYGTTFSGIVNRCQPPRAVTTGTTSTTSTTSSGGASSGTSSSSGAGSTGTAPASATTAPGTTSSGSSSSGSSSSGSSSSGSSSSGSGSSGSAAAPLALPGSDAREPEPAPTRSGSSTSTPERAPAPPPLALPPSTLD